jgi:hypothetical protein
MAFAVSFRAVHAAMAGQAAALLDHRAEMQDGLKL